MKALRAIDATNLPPLMAATDAKAVGDYTIATRDGGFNGAWHTAR